MSTPIEKIKKLLALANDKGASEDEAATAMKLAMGLMARHGINQSQVEDAKPESRSKQGKRMHKNKGRQFRTYDLLLAEAAGILYGCRLLFYGKNGSRGIEFVGRSDNIEAAELTLFWLVQQMDRFYAAAPVPPGADRRQFRVTFKDACARRVLTRAHKIVEDMERNDVAAQAGTGNNALVVKGYFDQLRAEAEDVLQGLGVVKTTKLNVRYGVGSAAGYEAGGHVQLRKEVE